MYDDWDDEDECDMPFELQDEYSDDYYAATGTAEVPARDRPPHIVEPAWVKVPDGHTRWADPKYL